MYFYNIKDREARDKMIEDYLALKKKIKENNLAERIQGMDYQRRLEEKYQPVVASNANMAQQLVKELKPIKLGFDELAKQLVKEEKNVELKPLCGMKPDVDSESNNRIHDLGPIANTFISRYMDSESKSKQIDTTFGIRYDYGTGMWRIGNKPVNLNTDDSMQVGGDNYEGTPGFWNLVTSKDPSANYTADDYDRYKELLWETSALHQHYDPMNQYPRASGSKKWRKFLGPIWNEFQSGGMVLSDEDDEDWDHDVSRSAQHGDGILKRNRRRFRLCKGRKIYLQKNKRCFHIQKKGSSILFTPRPRMAGVQGDVLYLRDGSSIYGGEDLLLGARSPFKKVQILEWLS